MKKLSIDQIRTKQIRSVRIAGYTTLFAGMFIVLYAFTHAGLTDSQLVKENLFVILIFGMLVTLFSIVSLFSNRNK
jgi:hypothetical protein